ncbi:MAG: ATP-binding protein, partial [Thermoplasmata archaeon]|nr:ATP-binding protein [Thermoplasmata archaeon]
MRVPQIDMIGRKPEREIIDKAFKRTLESQGQILLINGEAGIGKSTLTDYLDNIATESGIPICKGECTIQDAGIPYQGFQRALCDIAEDALFSLEDFAYFDEVFLISKIGLL